MVCIVTVRRLKPGAYEEFRKAWEADEWPPSMTKAWIMRNEQDPNEVAAMAFFEGADDGDPMRLDPERLASDEQRAARMAPFVESVRFSGLFRVIEDVDLGRVSPPGP